MTYVDLLALFIVIPILVLTTLTVRDFRAHKELPPMVRGWSPFLVLLALILLAILYTTPWDSHMIAQKVWWYNARRTTGIAMSGVPLEELGFFILQCSLVGLWLFWLAARMRTPSASTETTGALRLLGAGLVTLLCAISLTVLLSGWRPGTYLGWELAWALPPLILQLGVGADILWRYRVLICSTLFPAVLYLSAVDAIALHDGIWTIDPHQSLGVRIGGLLPLEEFLFFALTSTLVIFGLVLGVALESRSRPLAMRRSASHHQARV